MVSSMAEARLAEIRRMESSCTSMCTTVSNRPVALKPIAASRRSIGRFPNP